MIVGVRVEDTAKDLDSDNESVIFSCRVIVVSDRDSIGDSERVTLSVKDSVKVADWLRPSSEGDTVLVDSTDSVAVHVRSGNTL